MSTNQLALVILLLVIAIAGLATVVTPKPDGLAVDAVYDEETAMDLAGQSVPANLEGFYFVPIIEEQSIDLQSMDLAAVMNKAAIEQDYIGIVGANGEQVYAATVRALNLLKDDDVSGMTVIYLGRASDRGSMSRHARERGFELRYVTYP